MASLVSIQIQVEDNGSAAVIDQTSQKLESLGTAGQNASKQVASGAAAASSGVQSLGARGTTSLSNLRDRLVDTSKASKDLSSDVQALTGHTTTNLDTVRLLSQEFGLRLPRALESSLSRMPALMSGLNGFSNALLGVGFAEVFIHGAEAIYDAEQRYISITAAADKYYETLKKTSELDFSNTRDLSTTQLRLGQAEQGMAQFPRLAKALQNQGIGDLFGNPSLGLAELFSAHGASESGATAMGQTVDLTKQHLDETHEQALAQIELNHAMDGTLSRREQITAAERKAQQTTAENRTYSNRVQKFYGNPVPGDAGAIEDATKNAQARAEAAAKTIALNDEVSLAQIKARDAATQAGLQGEALYHQKQVDGVRELIAELNAQHRAEEIPERVRALNEQYRNEQIARVRQLTEETQRQHETLAASGLTGAARILAERDASVRDINQRQRDFSGGAPISAEAQGDFDQQRADAAASANQKIAELEQQFTDRVKALVEERTVASLGGYDRITAAAQKQVDDLLKSYNQDFENAKLTAEQKLQAQQNLAAGEQSIYAAAAQQRTELDARNREQDAQYDREAAQAEARVRQGGVLGWVNAYRDGIAEIEEQEQQRIARLQADAQKEGATQEEIERRKSDIVAASNAQIAEQNQQLQHTLAGQLESLFDNPMKFLQQKAKQAMFEILANWITQTKLFQNFFGNALGSLQPGAAGAGAGGAVGASSHSAAGIFSNSLNILTGHRSPSATVGTGSVVTSTAAPGFGGAAQQIILGQSSGGGTSTNVDVSIPGADNSPTAANGPNTIGLSRELSNYRGISSLDFTGQASSQGFSATPGVVAGTASSAGSFRSPIADSSIGRAVSTITTDAPSLARAFGISLPSVTSAGVLSSAAGTGSVTPAVAQQIARISNSVATSPGVVSSAPELAAAPV